MDKFELVKFSLSRLIKVEFYLRTRIIIKEILEIILYYQPNCFSDDKLFILLFDDIALTMGYTYKSLPQQKSIIREKFRFESQTNICNNQYLENKINHSQINLFS